MSVLKSGELEFVKNILLFKVWTKCYAVLTKEDRSLRLYSTKDAYFKGHFFESFTISATAEKGAFVELAPEEETESHKFVFK